MSRVLRSFAAFTCLLLVSGFGLVLGTGPAAATSTLLCRGYAGCRTLGLSSAGYNLANSTMYWRMYSGHNCTNYVAYRMVRSGLPNVRPWSGGGNASNWGHANSALTNSVPRVGAVAWWDAYVRPAGSAGHVAYVESVVSPDEIIVSQDSWGGDFSWARITRSGGSWPSGFVHFNDVRLTNTTRPTVSGTPKVGAVLAASPGLWQPAGLTYRYEWRADNVPIPGATGSTLNLGLALQGKQINVRVIASKLGYPTAYRGSVRTAAVEPGVISNTTTPTVTGEAKVDSTLVASPGTWTPTPSALAYQWTADGAPIEGATSATLVPDASLVGKALAVTVTASKSGYVDVASSSTTTLPVAPGTFTVTAPPALAYPTPGLRLRPGQTLTLDPGTIAPGDAEVSIEWRRAGVPVEGATGTTYPVTVADLGSRIAATVTVTKPGYTSLSLRAGPTWRVKAATALTVDATSPRRGRLHVAVRTAADGVQPVTGVVQVSTRGQVVEQLTLRQGAAATTLTGVPSGTRTVLVRYLGSPTTTRAAVRRSVRVR